MTDSTRNLLLFILAAILGVIALGGFLNWVTKEPSRRDLETQAVKLGHAEWVAGDHGPKFQWLECRKEIEDDRR